MRLIYIADPMCSWCYGFAKPLDELIKSPGAAAPLSVALVMGGLRPGTTDAITPAAAEQIFEHWRHVHEASGQPFAEAPATALHRPGFVYDTEPACRATVAIRSHWPTLVWRFFKALQAAFYAEARDVSQPEVLADIAGSLGIARPEFATAFSSEAMRQATQTDFEQVQAWGVRGFPSLLAEHDGALHMVSHGYVAIDALRERLARVGTGN